MNQVYRVVFNRSLGVWQCVSEIAKAGGKSSGKVAKPLVVAMSLVSGVVANQALAVDYTDGQTHTASTNPYYVMTTDNVQNAGSVFSTQDLYVTQTSGSKLNISNSSITQSSGTTIINSNGNIDIATQGELQAKDIAVGYDSPASMTIHDGGKASSHYLNIANLATSQGAKVDVIGTGSSLTSEMLRAGASGTGTLNVLQGGTVTGITTDTANPNTIIAGSSASSNGTINVDGANSTLSSDQLIIGNSGNGTLNITNGGVINNNTLAVVGYNMGGTNNVMTVKGAGSQFNSTGSLGIGARGNGTLNVLESGQVKVTNDIASGDSLSSASNKINVDGQGSLLESGKQIQIGVNGKSTLTATNGATVTTGDNFILGKATGSTGTATFDNATLNVNHDLAVGLAGTGTLNLNNNSKATIKGITGVGDTASSNGTLSVNHSNLSTDVLVAGISGKGNITLANQANATANLVQIGGYGTTGQTAVGTTTVDNSTLNAPVVVVGAFGNGTLNINNQGVVQTGSLERASNSTGSTVSFDNGKLQLTQSQPALFTNFTSNNLIDIKAGGATIDTQANNVNVFDTATITGAGNFNKEGTGLLAMNVASKGWTGETHINQGTLRLNGDYTMRDGEVLAVKLNSLDDYGKLEVTGNANVSQGTLKVKASDVVNSLITGNEPTAQWNNVVKGATRTGEFKGLNVVDTNNNTIANSRLVTDYSDATAVNLKLSPITPPVEPPVVTPPVEPPVVTPPVEPPVVTPPVEPPVVTPPVEPPVVTPPVEPPVVTPAPTTYVTANTNQKNNAVLDLAQVMDDTRNNPTSQNQVLSAVLNLTAQNGFTEKQIAQGTSELQPLFIGSVNRMVVDSNNLATNAIIEQSTQRERNVWAKVVGTQSTKDHDGNIMGYKAKDVGIIAGADTAVNDKLNLGMALSYIHTDADSDGHPIDHEMTAKNWQVLGYGDYQATDATRANFHIGAGQSDVKGERHIKTFGQTTAKSDYKVDTFQAGMGVSHRIGTEQKNIAPFAQVNYVQAKSDAYRETGAGAFNLDVKKHTYNSLRSTLGINVRQPLTPQVALTGTLAGAVENGDPRTDITASFAGTPNTTFVTKGREVGKEVGIAGIGLSYKPSALTEASINYMGEWRKDYDSQGVSLVFSKKF